MSERWRTVMVLSISVLFVLLYVGALLGWAGLAPNKEALGYIQPVVWVIIGYYFGRVPGERNESRLKERADKSDAAANAARRAASSAQVRLSAIRARLAAVRSALREGATQTGGEGVLAPGEHPTLVPPLSASVATALRILRELEPPSCDPCVQGAIEDWAGSEVSGMADVLRELYLPKHGPCDGGALRDLCDLLEERCYAGISPSDLKCTMTVADVVQVVCG